MVNGYDKLKGEIERIVNRDYDIELKELRGRARDSNHRVILTLKLSRYRRFYSNFGRVL